MGRDPRAARDVDQLIEDLNELIDAIDRRLPQVQRSGEVAIADAAMQLRQEARKRLDELEQRRSQSVD